MTVVSGQNLNIGHFSQPTARAMGHKVITFTSFERDIIGISVILSLTGAGVKSLIEYWLYRWNWPNLKRVIATWPSK